MMLHVADPYYTMGLAEADRWSGDLTKSQPAFFGSASSFGITHPEAHREQNFYPLQKASGETG